MKTKAVYVLTSTPEDFYYEQLFMSVYSLKYHNPDMTTVLITDDSTHKTFGPGRCKLLEYFDNVVVVDIPKEFNTMQCSRYLKTTLRKRVTGDIVFMDTDTIIAGLLDDIDNFSFDIGMVPVWHKKESQYYNGGLFYAKDTPQVHELFKLWHEFWLEAVKEGSNTDQRPLDKANKRMNYLIQEISGIWNCQISRIVTDGYCYLGNAKIIHYLISIQNTKLTYRIDSKLFAVIKEYDTIPNVGMEFIHHPIAAFNHYSLNLDGKMPLNNIVTSFLCYPRWIYCVDRICHVGLFFIMWWYKFKTMCYKCLNL